jgi:hypothetical protein
MLLSWVQLQLWNSRLKSTHECSCGTIIIDGSIGYGISILTSPESKLHFAHYELGLLHLTNCQRGNGSSVNLEQAASTAVHTCVLLWSLVRMSIYEASQGGKQKTGCGGQVLILQEENHLDDLQIYQHSWGWISTIYTCFCFVLKKCIKKKRKGAPICKDSMFTSRRLKRTCHHLVVVRTQTACTCCPLQLCIVPPLVFWACCLALVSCLSCW